MPTSYPPEFRRKVLNLLAAGRSVTEVAEALGISGACIYTLRKQNRIDRGELASLLLASEPTSPPPVGGSTQKIRRSAATRGTIAVPRVTV